MAQTEVLHNTGRLLVSCPDQPGIVAAISRFLSEQGANISHSDQHSTDPTEGLFIMRIEFQLPGFTQKRAALHEGFSQVASPFKMAWRFTDASVVKRLALFVSKGGHALFELLWRSRVGDLPAEVAMVISNHPDLESAVLPWGIPFYHTPVDPRNREKAEAVQLDLMGGKVDLVVLARYMQIVTPRLIAAYPNRMINIHHSFLPAFVGADPYARAYERGVKLIGATAHYVTADLDAGPIIEQDVQRVDHRHSVEELKRMGRYIERMVLARAVTWHVEDKVLVHGNKTVVFA